MPSLKLSAKIRISERNAKEKMIFSCFSTLSDERDAFNASLRKSETTPGKAKYKT